jgi:hypothetical protein
MSVKRKEWLCSCGAWVPEWALRHPHIAHVDPGIDAYRAMRAANEAGLSGIAADAFTQESKITYELWTPQHQHRKVAANGP